MKPAARPTADDGDLFFPTHNKRVDYIMTWYRDWTRWKNSSVQWSEILYCIYSAFVRGHERITRSNLVGHVEGVCRLFDRLLKNNNSNAFGITWKMNALMHAEYEDIMYYSMKKYWKQIFFYQRMCFDKVYGFYS